MTIRPGLFYSIIAISIIILASVIIIAINFNNTNSNNNTNTSTVQNKQDLLINNKNSTIYLTDNQLVNISLVNNELNLENINKSDINLTVTQFPYYVPKLNNFQNQNSVNFDLNSINDKFMLDHNILTLVFTYHQELSPFSGYGLFNLSLPKYPNTFFISNIVTFSYVISNKTLHVNNSLNQERLRSLETRNLTIEGEQFLTENELNMIHDYGLIRNSTFNSYNSQIPYYASYYIMLTYDIYIGNFTNWGNKTFSNSDLNTILKNGSNSVSDIPTLFNQQYTNLRNLTFDTGWISFQIFYFYQQSGPLMGTGILISQLSILDNYNSLEYFSYEAWMIAS